MRGLLRNVQLGLLAMPCTAWLGNGAVQGLKLQNCSQDRGTRSSAGHWEGQRDTGMGSANRISIPQQSLIISPSYPIISHHIPIIPHLLCPRESLKTEKQNKPIQKKNRKEPRKASATTKRGAGGWGSPSVPRGCLDWELSHS